MITVMVNQFNPVFVVATVPSPLPLRFCVAAAEYPSHAVDIGAATEARVAASVAALSAFLSSSTSTAPTAAAQAAAAGSSAVEDESTVDMRAFDALLTQASFQDLGRPLAGAGAGAGAGVCVW